MRIVTDYMDFLDEVKPINNSYQLYRMGLLCSTSIVGYFIPSEMEEVLNFCEFNKEFHIVSHLTAGFVVNFYHPKGSEYELAEGNADPDLVLDYRIEAELIKFDLVNETRELIKSCRSDLLRKRF